MNLNECLDKHSFECYNIAVIIQMNALQIKKKEWFKLENPTAEVTRTGMHPDAPYLNEKANQEELYTLPDKGLTERLQAITGGYLTEVDKIVRVMNDRYIGLVYENVALKQRIEQMAQLKTTDPETDYKVKFYDNFLSAKGTFTTTQIAEAFNKSAIWLHKFLKKQGVIYKSGAFWHITNTYAREGYVTNTVFLHDSNTEDVKEISHQLEWAPLGYRFICELLEKNGVRRNGTV